MILAHTPSSTGLALTLRTPSQEGSDSSTSVTFALPNSNTGANVSVSPDLCTSAVNDSQQPLSHLLSPLWPGERMSESAIPSDSAPVDLHPTSDVGLWDYGSNFGCTAGLPELPSLQHNHSVHTRSLQKSPSTSPPRVQCTQGQFPHQSMNSAFYNIAITQTTFSPTLYSPSPSTSPPTAFDRSSSPEEPLRFSITLQAPTAITQKTKQSHVTYLNRGQAYAISFQDHDRRDEVITSTLSITFHDASHRQAAVNYWKFWLGQQKSPKQARAVECDDMQSSGISNIQLDRFDRITFDWNGSCGAKIYCRFNCLSTDFSRIKGVKGIPLRVLVESRSGETLERSYSKIKLFRDKGAERKNKDDAKQIGKQFEKMQPSGDLQHHPMWLLYNQPLPFTTFIKVPEEPAVNAGCDMTTSVLLSGTSTTKRGEPLWNLPYDQSTYQPPVIPPSYQSSATPIVGQIQRMPEPFSVERRQVGSKRSFHDLTSASVSPSPEMKRPNLTVLTLCVYVPPRTSVSDSPLQRIQLETLTVRHLIDKLCTVLLLHPNQVSDVVWRRRLHSEPSTKKRDVLVLMEDAVISEQFQDNAVVAVDWEIKANGTVRLLLTPWY